MRRCGVQSADAADIMQETFLSVISAISRLEMTGADVSFRGWLWTIARNKLRDRQRRTLAADVVDGSEAGRLLETHVCNQHDDADPPSTTQRWPKVKRSRFCDPPSIRDHGECFGRPPWSGERSLTWLSR